MPASRASYVRVLITGLTAIAVGCVSEPGPQLVGVSGETVFAKPVAGITITAVTPDTASLGTTLDVRVIGSGFDAGSVAEFALNGVKDPNQVRTNHTRYVSSRELVANISISESATATTWDIVVTLGSKTGVGTESDVFKVLDPTATWLMAVDDPTLGVRGDGLYSDGAYSTYSHGVCRVDTHIYATSELSSSGDAIIRMDAPRGKVCVRRLVYTYPDGGTETRASTANLINLHNTTFSIPIGESINRKLNVNQGGGRCGRLLFGEGPQAGAGSDSVRVTRVDATTWQVQSQGQELALCENNGQLYRMPVRFTVISNTVLP